MITYTEIGLWLAVVLAAIVVGAAILSWVTDRTED